MAAPYTSVTVTGYNDNPPVDDGTESEENRILWETIKEKLPDPLKTAVEAINTNISTAFGKIVGGAGVVSSAISATVGASDQGKLYRATGAGITITTPDATSATSPFVFGFLNSSSGTVTLDGNGSQTVNGVASIVVPVGGGGVVWTDGSNWFIAGLGGVPAGKELGYGDIINGTIAESNGANAATYALKTLAGTDPSTSDPVLICFRNVTAGTGNYVYRTVTAALSLVIPSGAEMGFANATAGRLWIIAIDNAGTVELAAVNCRSGTNIYPLGQFPIISTTAIGTGSDSAHVPYSTSARTSVPYTILCYASYENGITTAGSWNASPTRIQLFGPGVPLPGAQIQLQGTATGAVATGTTTLPNDDTIPQNTEGNELMTQAITPTSKANILEIEAAAHLAHTADGVMEAALFQDSTADALAVTRIVAPTTNRCVSGQPIEHRMLAATTSATTFKVRAGSGTAGTMTFNGESGARLFGGVLNSFLRVRELMA